MNCNHKWNRSGNDTDETKELVCEKCNYVKEIGRTEHWQKNERK